MKRRFIRHPMVGQAWMGRHVVILRCTFNNQLVNTFISHHAPMEDLHSSCSESLSRLLSIGYRMITTTVLPMGQIEYVLVLE